jgi:hypothetical protein
MNRHPGGSGPKVRNADVDGGLRRRARSREAGGRRQGCDAELGGNGVFLGVGGRWANHAPSNSLSAPRMHFARDCILPTILFDSTAKRCIPRINFQASRRTSLQLHRS